MSSSLSFKIQKPTSKKRKGYEECNSNRSSDEEEDLIHSSKPRSKIELIHEFDSRHQKPEESLNSNGLMIPSLPNRDFRSIYLNKKSKKQMKLYKPDGLNSFGRPVKEDGKEEEMKKVENVDRMNSSVVLGGLKVNEKNSESKEREEKKEEKESEESKEREEEKEVKSKERIEPVLTLEEKAIQELMKGSREDSSLETKKEIEPILIREQDESLSRSSSNTDEDETSMFRKDVSRRPNPSSLEDYERVPVGSFGLALLKGMGWKEGTSASKNGRLGLLEAIVPKARPSLLGIGAKPLALDDQGKSGNGMGIGMGRKSKGKDDRKFVPLIRKVIDPQKTGGSDLRSDQASGSSSRSPSLKRPSSSRDQSSSRSDEKYKSRYVDEEERSLKDLRIRDDRGGRKERGSDRDEEERRNERYSEREERSRRDRRDRYDWIDRSGKEERRRGEERESERSRREERDGRGAERSRRDERDEGERKVGDERRRRDGHEEEEVGMYRKKGRDEEMRYRKSYDDERRRR